MVGGALSAVAALAVSYAAFAALPPVPAPPENPITQPKRILGKILFWDEQLSTSNVISCGTCHTPARAGADDRIARNPGLDRLLNTPDDVLGAAGSIRSNILDDFERDPVFGLAPQITSRASNSVINAAYAAVLFWDGRATGRFTDPETGQTAIANGGALESQAMAPIVNSVEMAHAGLNWAEVTEKLGRVQPLDLATDLPLDVATELSGHPDYPELFRRAFGDSAISARRIAFAIATYERTLIADQTPWDRFIAGEQNALTPQQAQGFQAFQQSRCINCHAQPLFTDQSFRNIGLRPIAEDTGRQAITGNLNDRGKFKVPSLRNVGRKRTFMHNGQFQTLGDVVAFYARAPGAPQQFPDNRDPIMQQVNVPPQAAAVIQDFLTGGLTDPGVAAQAFPFDRPTLFTTRPANQSTITGAGVPGSGGITPRIIAQSPPMIGNLEFRIGLDGAMGNASARLGISSAAPIGGRITPERYLTTLTAPGQGAGEGLATFHWPITANIASGGQVVYVQWFVTDSSATGGQALSPVARIPFFCGSSGCPQPCRADMNNDGGVDGQDIESFFDVWEAGDVVGDFNTDGGVDGQDVVAFFAMWELGC